jgi:hypothetical protein
MMNGRGMAENKLPFILHHSTFIHHFLQMPPESDAARSQRAEMPLRVLKMLQEFNKWYAYPLLLFGL